MPRFQLYDYLLKFPLFYGMSHNELELVVGETKFDFRKERADKVIFQEGETCDKIFFLTQGSIQLTASAADYSYKVGEILTAPTSICSTLLFGLKQRCTHTLSTLTDCNFITIDKTETLKLCADFEIFRLNLLNIACNDAQRLNSRNWRVAPTSLRQRIIRFFEAHCIRPAGEKHFQIKMTRLAEELNESRLEISRELNRMQADHLLSLGRGAIHIPMLEKLLM